MFVDQRLVVMLFKLFDRSDRGYFSFLEFEEIVDERMIPNFKKIVERERERWNIKQFSGQSTGIIERSSSIAQGHSRGNSEGGSQGYAHGGQFGGQQV